MAGWTGLMAALALLLSSCGGSAPAAPPPKLLGTVLDTAVPPQLLDMPFTTQSGRHVTLRSYRGKTIVISDVMTLCQESCALITAGMLQAARIEQRKGHSHHVVFLSISIDPQRDNLAHLAAYRRLFGARPNWQALTSTPTHLDRFWRTLGIWRHQVQVSRPYPRDWLTGRPLTTDIQHTDDLIFVDGSQRFRFEIEGLGNVGSKAAIPRRVYDFMDALGHRNTEDPGAGSWTGTQVAEVLTWINDTGGTP